MDKPQEKNKYICTLWDIFRTFSMIGFFTFGGGGAMLPMIQRAVVDDKGWLTDEDFCDIITVTNASPGALAINAAVFIGFRLRGLPGAIIGALGVVIPSFVTIILLAAIIIQMGGQVWLEKFFYGVRPAVVALIVVAAFRIGKISLKTVFDYVLLVIALALSVFTNLHPVILIITGALTGNIYHWLKEKRRKKEVA